MNLTKLEKMSHQLSHANQKVHCFHAKEMKKPWRSPYPLAVEVVLTGVSGVALISRERTELETTRTGFVTKIPLGNNFSKKTV